MAALLLFMLAVAGGVVVGECGKNPTAAEVTVFGQPVTGYSQAGCWPWRPRSAIMQLVGSLAAGVGRRGRREQGTCARTTRYGAFA